MSRAKFEPTDDQRRQVEGMSGYGVPQDDIAFMIGISPHTLRLAFRQELDIGIMKSHAKIRQGLYQKAFGGDMTAMIFIAKTQLGFREVARVEAEISGPGKGPVQTEVIRRVIIDPKKKDDEQSND